MLFSNRNHIKISILNNLRPPKYQHYLSLLLSLFLLSITQHISSTTYPGTSPTCRRYPHPTVFAVTFTSYYYNHDNHSYHHPYYHHLLITLIYYHHIFQGQPLPAKRPAARADPRIPGQARHHILTDAARIRLSPRARPGVHLSACLTADCSRGPVEAGMSPA